MENYYKILEIDKDASDEIIKNAYKTLVKKYHPDLQTGNNKIIAEEKIKKINEAYDVLSDKTKKQEYDNNLINENISIEQYNFILNENIKLKEELNYLKDNYYVSQKNNNYYNAKENNNYYTNTENYNNYDSQNNYQNYNNTQNNNYKHTSIFKTIFSIFLTFLLFFIIFKIPFFENILISLFGSDFIFLILIVLAFFYFFWRK